VLGRRRVSLKRSMPATGDGESKTLADHCLQATAVLSRDFRDPRFAPALPPRSGTLATDLTELSLG
jgi:hypothetical protein